MRNPYIATITVLAGIMILLGNAMAQQSPANPPMAPPPKTQGALAAQPPDTSMFKTQKEKLSYAIGLTVGRGLTSNLHRDSVDVDTDTLMQGIKDGLAGGKALMPDEEAKAAISALQADLRKKQAEKMQQLREANKKDGDAFLAANKTKEGVVTLPSGLQYKILTRGTGPKPAATDSVVCNYKGTLIDGTEFDSSYKRGQPATFPVGRVIKGWTEALQLMPVGSKWQLFIPADLAYGPSGNGPTIGPNATLIFEIELLSIKDTGK